MSSSAILTGKWPTFSYDNALSITSDGRADFLETDPKTGKTFASLNLGPAPNTPEGWAWRPIGPIATGLGPGALVHFADINGDGVRLHIQFPVLSLLRLL